MGPLWWFLPAGAGGAPAGSDFSVGRIRSWAYCLFTWIRPPAGSSFGGMERELSGAHDYSRLVCIVCAALNFNREATSLLVASWLVEADLGHELGKTWVGAQGIGHGVHVEVDEAVDAFLIGKVQQAKGFLGFAEADVDGCRV